MFLLLSLLFSSIQFSKIEHKVHVQCLLLDHEICGVSIDFCFWKIKCKNCDCLVTKCVLYYVAFEISNVH
jgi:hypothetical protein